jgi:PPOX class probable F420-dependent enzyme
VADLNLVRDIAASNQFLAVIATTRRNGTIHASLVNAGILEDPATGRPSVGMVIGGGAAKLRLLRRSGRATVVFQNGWRWAAVEGGVRLEGPDDPAPPRADTVLSELIRSVYRSAGGTHEDWDEFDRVMAEDRRCVAFVQAERVSSNQ